MLERLVHERTPYFFKDGDGRFPLTLAHTAGHAGGPRVQVHRQDGERLAYWLDARGRIRGAEREAAGQRTVTVFEEYIRATPGRVLPARVTTTRFDLESGVRLGAETVTDTHVRVCHVWLPATRHITMIGVNDSQTVHLEFSAHTLLGTL
jgi:hypothetical protein